MMPDESFGNYNESATTDTNTAFFLETYRKLTIVCTPCELA